MSESTALIPTQENPLAKLAYEREAELVGKMAPLEEGLRAIETTEIQSDDDELSFRNSLKPLREAEKAIRAIFKKEMEQYQPQLDAVDALKKRQKEIVDRLKKAQVTSKSKCEKWLTENEDRKIREAAEKKRKAQEEARKAQVAAAEQAKARGDTKTAEQILKEPLQIADIPDPGAAKAEGATVKPEYEFQITDWKAFVEQYVLKRPASAIPDIISVNEAKIKSILKQYGDTIQIPGMVITRKIKVKGSR